MTLDWRGMFLYLASTETGTSLRLDKEGFCELVKWVSTHEKQLLGEVPLQSRSDHFLAEWDKNGQLSLSVAVSPKKVLILTPAEQGQLVDCANSRLMPLHRGTILAVDSKGLCTPTEVFANDVPVADALLEWEDGELLPALLAA
ncbi:hypothetical protein [Seinonella peptonophila]|uniref:hypothetical protein n=1 Tax=Seinonella peptonophila TaxID=112248 RepID=UPI001114D0C0|nr:hypothetical protein [Seinonella peptonophila]